MTGTVSRIRGLIPTDHLENVRAKLHSSGYASCVSPCVAGVWFRYDTPDSDSREQSDNYDIVREELAAYGFELLDPLIEHDCISGDLCYVQETVKEEDETEQQLTADNLYNRALVEEQIKARAMNRSFVDLVAVEQTVLDLTRMPITDLIKYIERTAPTM